MKQPECSQVQSVFVQTEEARMQTKIEVKQYRKEIMY